MVRILIHMRAAMIAHQRSSRFGIVSLVALSLFGLVSALGTLLLGFAHYPTPAAAADVVGLVMAVWIIARVAYAAFSGGSVLRLELFRLQPIPRAKLGRALLIVGLLDPALLFMAAAFAALVALGAQQGVGAVVTGAVGALLSVLLTSILVSIVEAAMPAASRRRQDAGTMIVAVVISLVAIAGTLLPSLVAALTGETIPALSIVVRILPSGWAADAVAGATAGNLLLAALPLVGLIALTVVAARIWPAVLSRRLDGTLGSSRRIRSHGARRPLLPQTPTGGVTAKELRLWVRDPLRLTFLMIAAIVGLGVCVVPGISHGTSLLLPFAGVLTAVIAGAGGCNLYGSDGLPMRLTVMTPESERADVRGRQCALALLIGPYALCLTVALTLISGQAWAWPWVLGLLPAVVGGAVGLLPIASLVAVLPLDEKGGPAPAWPVKVYAALILTLVGACPTAAVLVAGGVIQSTAVQWLAVPMGAATGVVLAVALGRVATKRLTTHQFDILAQLTEASSPA